MNGVGPLDLPIQVIILQILIITLIVSLLSYPLGYLKQPTVIAEIIAGILLGPTVFGNIPGFTEHLFNIDDLLLVGTFANFGLILFLLRMGIDLDLDLLKETALRSASVAAAGMIVPFGLGAGIAYWFYVQFPSDQPVSYVSLFLFIGAAMACTALPVLARLLHDLDLFNKPIGHATLAAAVVNDIVAWLLLALCLAVAAFENHINIVYIALLLAGWLVLMWTLVNYAIRKISPYLVNDDGDLTQAGVGFFVMIAFSASWYTSFIGCHVVFGAFVTGMLVPREGNLHHHLRERIAPLTDVVFLPLYFAYTGLRTDLREMDTLMAWVGLLVVVLVTSISKIIPSAITAKYLKLTQTWRHSFAFGVFMNCKGLLEIIIVNIGYDVGVLTVEVFTIMVLLALITTFMTNPLALWLLSDKHKQDKSEGYEVIT